MTPKRLRPCVALATLAVAALVFAGCSTNGDKGGKMLTGKKKFKVVLAIPEFVRQANAYPKRLVITDYGTHPEQTITWHYTHKKSVITFDEKKIGTSGVVPCIDDDGECSVKLPAGLLPDSGPEKDKRILKYTVGGEDDGGKLNDNDPEIEIDR